MYFHFDYGVVADSDKHASIFPLWFCMPIMLKRQSVKYTKISLVIKRESKPKILPHKF